MRYRKRWPTSGKAAPSAMSSSPQPEHGALGPSERGRLAAGGHIKSRPEESSQPRGRMTWSSSADPGGLSDGKTQVAVGAPGTTRRELYMTAPERERWAGDSTQLSQGHVVTGGQIGAPPARSRGRGAGALSGDVGLPGLCGSGEPYVEGENYSLATLGFAGGNWVT